MYLRNCWYAAAFSDEVTREPLSRTLLDTPIVFFRREDGTPVALRDRCPHRFAPLSTGRVVGDTIQCGYHGLAFDCTSRCVSNPHNGGKPLGAADIDSYHLYERYGFVWIWPGDPARADPAKLPHFPYLEDDSRWSTLKGRLHVKSNYQLVSDNLLDLTHVAFLHPAFGIPSVSAEQQLAGTQTRLDRFDDRIVAFRLRTGLPPNRPTIELFGFPPNPAESRTHMTWYPPALIDFDNGTKFPGQDDMEGLCFPQAHCITPETETTCHYFFAAARNLRLGDPEVDKALMRVLDVAFRTEDEPMIEAVQQRMGSTGDLDSLNPVLLKSDGPPVAARRLLKELIAREQAEAQAIAAE